MGTNGVALLVVLGFKNFLFEIDGVEITFLLLSLSYLSFLSWRIATSDNKTGFKQSLKAPRLYEGIFLQFVNPKAYVVQGHLFVVLSLGMASYNVEILTKFIIVNYNLRLTVLIKKWKHQPTLPLMLILGKMLKRCFLFFTKSAFTEV